MNKEKVKEKCELIISDINNIIDDLDFDEKKTAIEMVINELIVILEIVKIFS